jgi:hypothetical protein
MGRTRKDSKQGTVIEVIRRKDGSFDLLLNRRLDHGSIHEDGLADVLCVRFGYCGDEFVAILRESKESGRAERRY